MKETDRKILGYAARQHFLVSRQQLFQLGLSRDGADWRIESGFLVPVHHEVYRIADTPRTWLQEVMAATLAGGHGTVAAHETSRALWVPGSAPERPINVMIPRGRNHTVEGVVAHESRNLMPVDVTTLFGI